MNENLKKSQKINDCIDVITAIATFLLIVFLSI